MYDALNVLEAIGMIDKTKKSIRWRGWPTVRPYAAHSLMLLCTRERGAGGGGQRASS